MNYIAYDSFSAVEYARRWALGRNPEYYDFEELGGDCTGFVSQCIFAGAKVMNFTPIFGWYYLSPDDRTASWTGVEFLYDFLTGNVGAGPYAREADEAAALPGDIVQLGRYTGEFYHTMVITESAPEILVAAHSYDALDRPLKTYDFEIVRFLHIEGVRAW